MSLVAPGSDSSVPDSSVPDGSGPGGSGADSTSGPWRKSIVADSRPGNELAVWTDQSANRCILKLRGRLCADTVAVLDRHVDRLGCRWCDEVVVDLVGLVLMDLVGARLLVGFGHYVAGRGGRFEIRGAGEEISTLIRAAEEQLEA